MYTDRAAVVPLLYTWVSRACLGRRLFGRCVRGAAGRYVQRCMEWIHIGTAIVRTQSQIYYEKGEVSPMNNLKERKLDNKGFSLVELIIVIAIMAVLIGVLAPQYLKYVERSRQSADIDNVNQMISAVEIFAADPVEGATVTGKIECKSGAVTTNGGNVRDALDAAGLPATLPKMKSSAYQTWTLEFHANGIQFTGTNGTDLATALGRTSVAP